MQDAAIRPDHTVNHQVKAQLKASSCGEAAREFMRLHGCEVARDQNRTLPEDAHAVALLPEDIARRS